MENSRSLAESSDADLGACESLCGFVKDWIDFTREHDNLTIEIRTKSGRCDLWSRYSIQACSAQQCVIIAYTLSPQKVASEYEHFASALSERIKAAKCAMDNGFLVRLCFDPMIYCPGWKEEYERLVTEVFSHLDGSKLWDVSVGSFRISQDYLKKMRKDMPRSAVVNFPYDNVNGYYQYPENIRKNMEEYMVKLLLKYIPEEKLFRWK